MLKRWRTSKALRPVSSAIGKPAVDPSNPRLVARTSLRVYETLRIALTSGVNTGVTVTVASRAIECRSDTRSITVPNCGDRRLAVGDTAPVVVTNADAGEKTRRPPSSASVNRVTPAKLRSTIPGWLMLYEYS